MKKIDYIPAASVDEASALLLEGRRVLAAGGTDLIGVLKDRLLPHPPEAVVSLKGIPEFSYIRSEADGVHIGAGTTLREIAEDATVEAELPALAQAAYSVATPNLRSTATIAGNICQDIRCWYYRYPNNLAGRIDCARKEGHLCYAAMGENRYHSIFGGAKVCETPCTGNCPAKTDIPAYMDKLREGDVDAAARIILEVNPMPAITSRVCAHFCMENCNRNHYDDALNVGSVERYVGDYILDNVDKYMVAPAAENGKSVAIVGSGPAGLTAAYYLRQAGYAVTVYEKQKEAGGCLTYAIPAYRLPKTIVSRFIAALEGMGVAVRCGVNVGQDVSLEDIVKANHSVMLDTGTWKRPLIGISGEEVTRFGLDFLVAVNSYILEKPGSDVVVVGGGNVAMDVAITAKRLGSKNVRMVCLEDRGHMPANQEEIDRALEEGVEIINGWGPRHITKNADGQVNGIEFIACTRVVDDTGRFNPQYDEAQQMKLDADVILMAIGQQADLAFLEGAYKVETERGRILALEGNKTSVPGIFAGGDVTTGPATVIAAIAAGKNTALSVNAYCAGGPLPVERAEAGRAKDGVLRFHCQYKQRQYAVAQPLLPIEERGMDKEDLGGISQNRAETEAGRCFNCGCLAVNSSDVANALLVYDAVVTTNLRTLTAGALLAAKTRVADVLLPGEVVTEITIPHPAAGSVSAYNKYRLRKSIDFAILAVASSYTLADGLIQDARIVLGAAAPVPLRARNAEEFLRGKAPTAENAAAAAELALEGALPLDKNAYKIDMAKVMVKNSIDSLPARG